MISDVMFFLFLLLIWGIYWGTTTSFVGKVFAPKFIKGADVLQWQYRSADVRLLVLYQTQVYVSMHKSKKHIKEILMQLDEF